MSLDRDLIVFHGKVISVAEKLCHASCSSREAEPFVDMLFSKYIDSGKPSDVESWLQVHLPQEFCFVTESPQWVEDEPSWPFLNGRPMVFISQTSLPENQVTTESLTWDTEVYLFGARVPLEGSKGDSYGIQYVTVMQHRDFGGTGQ